MKKNNIIIAILIIIIVLLLSYIVYDKFIQDNNHSDIKEDNVATLTDLINLDYLNIYLFSDGTIYLSPINKEKINNLKVENNLKERLKTLYDRSFYYDVLIDGNKLRGFRINLDSKVEKMRTIEDEDNLYVIFIKENHTIGLFDYMGYYDLLYTDILDNYKEIKNVKDVKDNKLVYLDGSKESLNVR